MERQEMSCADAELPGSGWQDPIGDIGHDAQLVRNEKIAICELSCSDWKSATIVNLRKGIAFRRNLVTALMQRNFVEAHKIVRRHLDRLYALYFGASGAGQSKSERRAVSTGRTTSVHRRAALRF
jgi:hypothetical protein